MQETIFYKNESLFGLFFIFNMPAPTAICIENFPSFKGYLFFTLVDWPGTQRYELAQHKYLVLSVPVQNDKNSDLEVSGDPCLTLVVRHGH